MSTAPFNGQVLGQTHYATRAVLERELAAIGISFPESVALTLVAVEGGAADRAALTRRMAGNLKVGEPEVAATLDGLVTAGLLRAEGAGLARTAAGRDVGDRVGAAVAAITARLYADIPAEEMAVAGRVLELVRRRADAELAANRA